MNHSVRLFTLIVISASFCCNCEREDDNEIPEIPDDNFWIMMIMQGVDSDGDRKISMDEAAAVDSLNLSYGYYYYQGGEVELVITDLTGIEAFVNLKVLICSFQQLPELDISKNTKLRHLDFSDNRLNRLDLTENTLLEQLYCAGNYLTHLDLSGTPALGDLEYLDCSDNYFSQPELRNPSKFIMRRHA
jgi:hypothetical protein